MNACWIDEHQSADYAKLAHYGIDTPSFSIRESLVAPMLAEAHRRTGKGSVYFAWNWYPGLSGSTLADVVSHELEGIIGDLSALGVPTTPEFPGVCANLEDDAKLQGSAWVAYVVAFCSRWRQHRQKRATDWAFAAHKAGLFAGNAAAVAAIAAARVGVVTELYAGADWREQDGLTLALDLVKVGFPASLIHGFYDGARPLPQWWDGYVFTQGRLPS
jgi:hypothetical protein